MYGKKFIVPSVLLSIGIANLILLLLFPSIEFNILLGTFFVLFTLLAIGTYKSGERTFVKKGTVSELLPYIDFKLPSSTHLEGLRLKKESGHIEISGIFKVDRENVRLQLLHIKENHLPSTSTTSKTPQELLYNTIKEKDRQTLDINKIKEDTQFKICGETISAYTTELLTEKEAHPVLRGVANLREKGLLIISIAADSTKGLHRAKKYLTNLSY